MNFDLWQHVNTEIGTIQFMLLIINAMLHIIFAGAVAKDSGQLTKHHHKIYLVSGTTWAIATLIGGPLIAVGYWFIHHLRALKS
jgi:hypothetical protein